MPVDLSQYQNSWYSPGRPVWLRALWFFAGLPLLRASWMPSSRVRRQLLRAFGAGVGRGVVIKPGVRVKYPWLLDIGEHCWIGEDAWIDNPGPVRLEKNVCLSQGVYICTGNHDWSDPAFGLKLGPIVIREGAWIGARALICPGVEVGQGAVAGAGSVVTKNLEPDTIYAGNPAAAVRARVIRNAPERVRALTRSLNQGRTAAE